MPSPSLEAGEDRWKVRTSIDAVVADAYGLSRDQYAHVLSTFSHTSYPKAPELCLAKFDELKAMGLEAFTKKYDPYWDIPLNENLPKPVIDLPGMEEQGTRSQESRVSKTRGRKAAPWESPSSEFPLPSPTRTQLSLLPPDAGPLLSEAASANKPPVPEPAQAPRKASHPDGLDADTYELIKILLEERGVLTSGDAQDLVGLDAGGVRSYLRRLVEEGLAVSEGQRRGTQYRRLDR